MALPTELAKVHNLSAVVVDPTHILVTDETVYPVYGRRNSHAYPRDEFAMALFVLNEALDEVLLFDQSNPIPGAWTWEGSFVKYNFYAFSAEVYTTHANYTISTNGCIVYYEGHSGAFYKQVANTPTGNPLVDTTSWKRLDVGYDVGGGVLDLEGVFNEFWTSIYTNNQNVTYGHTSATLAQGVNTDSSFVISKTACHEWFVESTIAAGDTITSAKIYEYDGTELSDLTADSNGDYSIELDADGVFIVEIVVENSNSEEDTFYLPIFEFCDAEACYTALFKYVKCKCSDPCDADCAEREALDQRRNDMVLIRSMLDDIKAKVYIEKSQFIGIYENTAEREDYIEQIGREIDLLAEVVSRCGACDDETNDVSC